MSKAHELQKLFDAIVDYQRDPNPITEEVMKEQKKACLIVWREEAQQIIFRAMHFAEKHPLPV